MSGIDTGAAATTAGPSPDPRAGLLQRMSDWVGERSNPMLVRVVRQELRSKTFIGVFSLLLVAGIVSALVVAAFSDVSGEGSSARLFFGVLGWAWAFSLVLVQPLASFRAVAIERNDDTWDLVELTGMRPRLVVRGLLVASMVQGLLYTAALAPFMVMAWLLRGLDLVYIVFVLCVVPLAGSAASSLAVFTACLGGNKALRGLLGALLGLGLTLSWIFSAGFFFAPADFTVRWLLTGLRSGDAEVWALVGLWLNIWLVWVVICNVFSGALLTFRAADRSSGPRLAWTLVLPNALLWAIGLWLVVPGARNDLNEILMAIAIFGSAWILPLALFAVTEDYELSPRQARAITDGGPLRRAAMLFLGPGAARGRLLYLALSLAVLAVGLVGYAQTTAGNDPDMPQILRGIWAVHCYGAVIFLGSDLLYRGPFASWFPTPPLRRAFTLLVAAVVTLLPILAIGLLIGERMMRLPLAAISPVIGVMQVADRQGYEGTLIAISIAGLLASAALLVQGLRLQLSIVRVHARDDDRNPRGA